MSNPIKLSLKTEFFPVLLIIFSCLASVYFYFHLPAIVPTHWNFDGQPNGWGSGQAQSIFFPAMIIGIYILFLLIPYLDPRKERYEQFSKIYHIFKMIILLILTVIYFIASLNGLGYNISVGFWTPVLIGLMFIVMGNYMGKLKRNWFIGIRTPWTLSSEAVWNRTHRFGGKMFMLSGLLIMLEGFLPVAWRLPVFVIAMIIVLLGTIGYSYFAFVQEKKAKIIK
jgi:uncharacterized membrane protein